MRTDVVFLSAPDAIRLYYGSTFLRGKQLVELLSTRLSDRYSLTFTADSPTDRFRYHPDQGISGVRFAAVAGRSQGGPEHIAGRSRGSRDARHRPDRAGGGGRRVRGFLEAAYDGVLNQFPESPPSGDDNVDQRLPVFEPPRDKLRLAYVGLSQNCRYLSELGQLAEIFETPSGGSTDRWMTCLPEFNCHYALRRPDDSFGFKSFIVGLFGRAHDSVVFRPSAKGLFSRPHDFVVFKPFTKGFTAAHCLSPNPDRAQRKRRGILSSGRLSLLSARRQLA